MPKDANQIRQLLSRPDRSVVLPCCYDGLTARLIERAGFECTFMTGFGVSAVHGFPDTQLISYEEMVASARRICSSLQSIPCIGDGDTGYGNAVNVKRTVKGYIQAGLAGIMLEDQVMPKRCGHTKGKQVVSREEAYIRIQAAVDARRESGQDIVIIARTDARATHSLEEAIARCQEFQRLGADITFLEAPRSIEEMQRVCKEVPGWKMANMVEHGVTPILPINQLHDMGYQLIAYPLTILGASIQAMNTALKHLKELGHTPELVQSLATFDQIKADVGFDEYYAEEEKYRY
ncbi:carboxyvinyl-carboxyphosphonate phosphorylmutase [Thraustotheca clavata]|uniref:Carboxyvinyl-carboxyphosphonate phosphorylmutase n=1 Tax=Thraustotheca clavata TaxID=74557 RepID=A0A1V9ZZC3_9STRA|nr:carboxyvinyl-carboxyphosphonate phosphorylmutase [Thraustotheca clavata]